MASSAYIANEFTPCGRRLILKALKHACPQLPAGPNSRPRLRNRCRQRSEDVGFALQRYAQERFLRSIPGFQTSTQTHEM